MPQLVEKQNSIHYEKRKQHFVLLIGMYMDGYSEQLCVVEKTGCIS